MERTWLMVPVSPKVPDHIARRIDMAKDLYRYSYFRYGFRDTSFLYMLLAYEAALRDSFKTDNADLELLINSADRTGLIPAWYPAWKVHALRRIRNAHMHGLVYSPGSSSQDWILVLVDLINCVFDEEARINCPPLYVPLMVNRKQRDAFLAGMSDVDNSILQPGDSLVFAGTQEKYGAGAYICFKCKKVMRLSAESPQLPLCRGCRCGSFKYVRATK